MTSERDALAELVTLHDNTEWVAWTGSWTNAWAAARAALAAQPDNDQSGGADKIVQPDKGHDRPEAVTPDPTAAPAQGEPQDYDNDLLRRLRIPLVFDVSPTFMRENLALSNKDRANAADLIGRQAREIAGVKDMLQSVANACSRAEHGWKEESDDGDAVLVTVTLDPEQYRTEGGRLNVPKIRAAIADRQSRAIRDGIATQDAIARLSDERDKLLYRIGLCDELNKAANIRAERAEAERDALREDAERYRAIRAVESVGQTVAGYDANVDRMYRVNAARAKVKL